MKKSLNIFIILAACLLCLWPAVSKATFFGDVKTGLQNVASDRYGYSLFVPSDYTADRSWPLVMALHDQGDRGENYIKSWAAEAKKRGVIVFCPTYEEARNGLPYEHDARLIKLKQEIQAQYEIDPHKVLVAGYGTGGHYAFYLGIRYPQEFSAVASIGNALKGSLEKLFAYPYAEVHHLPVLMLTSKNSHEMDSSATAAGLKTMQEKGYSIETVEADSVKDLKNPNLNSYILEWFQQVSSERKEELEKRGFSVKQKFYEWVDQLLQNR